MIGSSNCIYETPCGWCSKWDKKCDRKIGKDSPTPSDIYTPEEIREKYISTLTQVKPIDTSLTDSATSISSKPKRCGSCDKTDGMCYTNPSQVKCIITGRFHFFDDICDCDTITATN